MSTSRTVINLVVLGLVALLLAAYAFVNWVGAGILRPTYELTVAMPDAGGIAADQAVTVRGVQVGQVRELTLTEEGVDITLTIEAAKHVPERTVVQVLRRSPIGEQSIEFIPVSAGWEPDEEDRSRVVPARVPVDSDWAAAPENARIEPIVVVLPSSVPALLDRGRELLAAVDGEDLSTLVVELAEAFGGRTELIQRLNRDAADLGATLVDGIPEFERLIDSSGPVLESLREHRDALASSFTSAADLSERLADNRPTLERLTDEGRRALLQADALVRNERDDLSCLVHDLETLSEVFAQDDRRALLAQLLDLNTFFYRGFDAGTQWDPFRPGIIWARVNILMFEESGGRPYVPPRETPATRPGAACISAFGVGVNAVRQHDPPPVPADPTSPGIQYAPLVDDDGPRRDGGGRAGRRSGSTEPLPATGGGSSPLALVPLAVAAAAVSVRRRLT